MNSKLYCAAALLLAFSGAAYAAELVQIGPAQMHLLPHGKEVDAIYGDYLLRSDKIAVTLGGTAAFRDANVNTQSVQGAVMDLVRLDLPGGDNDLLDEYYPQGHYLDSPGPTKAEILKANGPEVMIRFTRAATPNMQGDPVNVETTYTLRDGEPYLRIATTYSNPGSKAANAAVYDKMRADTLFRIPPAGTTNSLIYYEPWNNAAYGVVRAGGLPIKSYANPANVTYFEEGGNRLDFPDLMTKDPSAVPIGKTYPLPTPIPAGGSVKVERFLIPGRHPADVQLVIAGLLHEAITQVPVRVKDEQGHPINEAIVRALNGKTVLSEGKTAADGSITLAVKSGEPFDVVVTQRGRENVRSAAVKNGADVVMGPLALATFDVTDTTNGRVKGPAKIMIHGIDGTPDPNFAPEAIAFQAGNLCFTPNGACTVALPPGKYEALIGRGPQYTLETKRFEAAYGKTAPVAADIHRTFETPGWIIADFHNHTTNSNDSIADPIGRVVGIAAGGVQFAPASEHNRISTFAPYIEKAHLSAFLHSAGGIELSGRPGPGALNHQNGFPLKIVEGAQGGGAPQTDKDPKVQISRLFHYDNDAPKFVQQNHPDVGWLYFDRDQDGKIDGGFGTRPYTMAMELSREIVKLLRDLETQGGPKTPSRAFEWLQMLNQGDRIYGTANSDAHVTANNNGSIFMYLKSSTNDPARLDPAELAREAKAGHMVMSNGPFLDVSVDGVISGGDVKLKPTSRLKVVVKCAPWLDIDRVQVLVNGRPDPALNFTRGASSNGFHSGTDSVRFERELPLKLTADAHIIVIAAGQSFHIGPYEGTYAQQPPTAVSNPIFVDVDGNGFIPNKDTLGVPLPVSSKKPAAGGGER
jgi:hypothetical protein